MRTYTITEDQVREYNLERLFKKETNKWYVVRHNSPNMQDAFVFLQKESVEYTFGFNHHGEWTDIYNNENLYIQYSADIVRLDTDQEIKNLLILEAQKRKVWNVPMVRINGDKMTAQQFIEAIDFSNDELWSTYGQVYYAGKWARPLQKDTIEDRLSRIEKHLGL